jgi:hypothetical protein
MLGGKVVEECVECKCSHMDGEHCKVYDFPKLKWQAGHPFFSRCSCAPPAIIESGKKFVNPLKQSKRSRR